MFEGDTMVTSKCRHVIHSRISTKPTQAAAGEGELPERPKPLAGADLVSSVAVNEARVQWVLYAEGLERQLREAIAQRDEAREQLKRIAAAWGAYEQWECFSDMAYFDMWAVRPVGETKWGACFHVPSREEAEGLRDLLNKLSAPDDRVKPVGRQTEGQHGTLRAAVHDALGRYQVTHIHAALLAGLEGEFEPLNENDTSEAAPPSGATPTEEL
jgi:hypothetical protein